MKHIILSADIAGKKLTLETGKLARQATASVLVTYGETTILATLVMAKNPREGADFLPLKIDFDEKFYASGKIKGSRFIKREGRPADEAVLVARAIDRTLRPLFPKGFYNEMQIILTVFSYDGENKADMVAGIAACAVLGASEAPIAGIAALGRVAQVGDQLISYPTKTQLKEANLDIIVGSIEDRVIMLEAGIQEVPEERVFEAIEFQMVENQKVSAVIADLVQQLNITRMQFTPSTYDTELYTRVLEYVKQPMERIYENVDKMERQMIVDEIKQETLDYFQTQYEADEWHTKEHEISELFEKAMKSIIRSEILLHERRVGGRSLDEVRPLHIEAGVFPRVHGSALFQRGETQGISVVTLGAGSDALLLDSMEGEETRTYMHHYNFPPFSVGDISTRRATGNREIGHGALAERALLPVIPSQDEFPYTIRVVTEILESNGSSSMASACGSTLALMDAGVPIKRPVSGIAMGLMVDQETGNYKVLTDLQDIEDFGGDMDFKVTGTRLGVTAIQVDMKVQGISFAIVRDALEKARAGRLFIMDAMLEVIAAPRSDLKSTAPRIESVRIHPDQIRDVIGKGGETINKIIAETGVSIDIQDDGRVDIFSSDAEGMRKAVEWVKNLTRKIEIGEVIDAKVVRIVEFGAFVSFPNGVDALCHISELAHRRVAKVEEVVKLGDVLKVKVLNIDNQGRYSVSHKATLEQ